MQALTPVQAFVSGMILPEVFDEHVAKYLSAADRGMLAYVSKSRLRAAVDLGPRILPISGFVTSVSRARWAMERPDACLKEHMCYWAACTGTTDVMDWLYTNHWYAEGLRDCALAAAKRGHLLGLNWLCEKGYMLTAETAKFAALGGQTDVLAWIYSEDMRASPYPSLMFHTTLAFAAAAGHLDTVKWLHTGGHAHGDASILAAQFGQLDVLKWLQSNNMLDAEAKCCTVAAEHGQFHVLRWAHEVGLQWTASTTDNLARSGHLEMLQWAFVNECPMSSDMVHMLAGAGSIEGVQWSLSLGFVWDVHVCFAAALKGKLEFIQWAFSNDHPRDSVKTCILAAEEGHFHVLRWLITNGGGASAQVTFILARDRKYDELKWALTNGCPMDPDALFNLCRYNIIDIDPEMVKLQR